MKPVRTWIVIADGARARILANCGVGKGVQQVKGADFRAEDAGTGAPDRPGRTFDSVGGGRHSMEPSSDPFKLAKKKFLRGLAEYLRKSAESARYDRLVILAPPRALGDLRQALPDCVRALVAAEQARDLTPLPNEDIPKHLGGLLAV